MIARSRGLAAALLAGMLLSTGCIGAVDLLGLSARLPGGGEEAVQDASRAAQSSAGAGHGDKGTTFVALSFLLHLDDESRAPLTLLDARVHPLPTTGAAFVAKAGPIAPGDRVAAGALAVAEGTELTDLTLELTVHDGVGEAVLELHLDRWRASEDIVQVVELATHRPGVVTAASEQGPLSLTPLPAQAEPRYGYLLWPGGQREPLAETEHVIEVPAGYPDRLEKGDRVTFQVPTAYDRVTWYHDDEELHVGSTLPFDVGAGPHTLAVEIGEGAERVELPYRTDDQITFHGHILAGAPADEEELNGVSGNMLFFPIFEQAERMEIKVRPTSNVGPVDLDLYLYEPSGELIAKADGPRPFETLVYDGPLPAGEYHLRVHAQTGVDVRFNATLEITY